MKEEKLKRKIVALEKKCDTPTGECVFPVSLCCSCQIKNDITNLKIELKKLQLQKVKE